MNGKILEIGVGKINQLSTCLFQLRILLYLANENSFQKKIAQGEKFEPRKVGSRQQRHMGPLSDSKWEAISRLIS